MLSRIRELKSERIPVGEIGDEKAKEAAKKANKCMQSQSMEERRGNHTSAKGYVMHTEVT